MLQTKNQKLLMQKVFAIVLAVVLMMTTLLVMAGVKTNAANISSDAIISDANFDEDVTVNKGVEVTITGDVTVNGNLYIKGSLDVKGSLVVHGTIFCLNYNDKSAGDYDFGYLVKNGGKIQAYDLAVSDVFLSAKDKENQEADKKTNDSDIVRIYGDTRYSTSLSVADNMESLNAKDGFDNIIVAYSNNFADALAGSYLAAVKDAPILIVNSITPDSSVSQMKTYIQKNLNAGGTVYLLGGTSVVSENFEKSLASIADKVVRIAGDTRFETNIKILKTAGYQDGDLLVADGSSFADALSASATGKAILLVDKNSGKLTDAQKEYLATVNPEKIYVLGGTSAVPESIATELETMYKTKPTRLEGKTRYETSVKIANTFFDTKTTQEVVLAWGGNFPDGLCAGPVAYKMGAPLILTQEYTDNSQNPAVDYVSMLPSDFKVLAVGGPGSAQKQLTDAAINALKKGSITEAEYGFIA